MKKINKEIEDKTILTEEFDDNFVVVEGFYVQTNVGDIIVHEEEIGIFTSMTKNVLSQKQMIPYIYDIEFFIKAAKDLFESVEIVNDPDHNLEEDDLQMNISGVEVFYKKKLKAIEWKWLATPKLDFVTDAIGLLATQLSKNPPAGMLKEVTQHRKETQSFKQQFEVFIDILKDSGYAVKVKEDDSEQPIVELYDCSHNKTIEIDYCKKVAKGNDQQLKDRILDLLQINHSANNC